jgi:hypothetical protein
MSGGRGILVDKRGIPDPGEAYLGLLRGKNASLVKRKGLFQKGDEQWYR